MEIREQSQNITFIVLEGKMLENSDMNLDHTHK